MFGKANSINGQLSQNLLFYGLRRYINSNFARDSENQ